MSSSADGDVNTSSVDNLIDLNVLCLNGEGCTLSISPSTLGLQVGEMVAQQLPTKKGAKLALYHLESSRH